MHKIIGAGESCNRLPTSAVASPDKDIWIKPRREEVVPAISGKGFNAVAMACGNTRPIPVEKNTMGNISTIID